LSTLPTAQAIHLDRGYRARGDRIWVVPELWKIASPTLHHQIVDGGNDDRALARLVSIEIV
jgi:hypothetical protein